MHKDFYIKTINIKKYFGRFTIKNRISNFFHMQINILESTLKNSVELSDIKLPLISLSGKKLFSQMAFRC